MNTVDADTELDEIAVSIHTETKPATRQSYSAEKIAQLTNNDEIKWAMHIVEIYLDRPLKPMDLQLILYLYEELHFSAELIMYLYEYCVSKGKKNASYIEAVALTWAEEGIDTEEKAKEATATYNDHFNAVNKAFGLNRAPGQIERQYITKWVEVFGFSDDIIIEACNRTILRTQKPDFKYTDKILETWYKKNAKTLTDIARLDDEFSKASKNLDMNKVTTMTKPAQNKFNQFPQRTYSAQDYADLERKLLNKGL
jgi:DnaD/phage-associated family protein